MPAPRNLLFIVFDSCRYDSFAAASTPRIDKIGEAARCYSFASWTLPSHHAYLMGVSPHRNPRGVFASEVYKKDFVTWSARLNIPDVGLKDFVPQFSLPKFLRNKGYKTHALVSMPVLNEFTIMNQHFDRYQLMENHDDFSAMIDALEFGNQPSFHFLNVGETHYPYTVRGETVGDKELLHGPAGVFRHVGDEVPGDDPDGARYFHLDRLEELRKKQVRNVEHLDALFEKLADKVPPNTYVIITADHGELFGEAGFFGHGPIMHELVFEVFQVEGLIR